MHLYLLSAHKQTPVPKFLRHRGRIGRPGFSNEISVTLQDLNYDHHEMRVLLPPRVQSTLEGSDNSRGGAHEPLRTTHSSNHRTNRKALAPGLERILPWVHRFLKSPLADSSRFIT
jgi:hypothetical protein